MISCQAFHGCALPLHLSLVTYIFVSSFTFIIITHRFLSLSSLSNHDKSFLSIFRNLAIIVPVVLHKPWEGILPVVTFVDVVVVQIPAEGKRRKEEEDRQMEEEGTERGKEM